jgi:hypothetical protein
MEALLPALAVAAILVLVFWLSWVGKRKRREAMRAIAGELGGRFFEDDPYGLSERHDGRFPALREGSNRYAYNVIHAERDGLPVWIFDHHHETYSTDHKGHRTTHHHHGTFVLVRHDVDLGQLDVREEGIFDKVAAAFGFDDIDFESAEFSRRWRVKAADREFAYQVFHPRMMEYFLALDGLTLATNGPYGLYRLGRGTMDPGEIGRTLRIVTDFVERLPRFVRKDRAL